MDALLPSLLGLSVEHHISFGPETGGTCLSIAELDSGALDVYMDKGTIETGVRLSLSLSEVVQLRDFLNDWLDA